MGASRRGVTRIAAAAFGLLQLLPGLVTEEAAGSEPPALGRVTAIHASGSAAVEAMLDRQARITFANPFTGDTAHLTSRGGRFAGVLVQELREDRPSGIGNQVMFVRLFPPLDCSPTRCVTYEEQWAAWVPPPGVEPPEDAIDLPAGRYRISLLADGAAETSASLLLDGLDGSADLAATQPIRFHAAVVGEPLAIAGFEPSVAGGATGTIDGFGRSFIFTWAVLGPGAVSVFQHCIGDPEDRTRFDSDGNCQPTLGPGGQASGGGGSTHTYSVYISCSRVACQERPVRMAFRWTHPPGYNQGLGGLIFWISYGLA